MTDDMDRNAADLLHMLGHLYIKSGSRKRGLVLLLLAAQIAPAHPGILHTLTQAFIVTGDTQRALETVGHLEHLQGPSPTFSLLRSRALWVAGHHGDARHYFRDYVQRRSEG
ncbi:hypothetical protein L861_13615 [Litchfieldella anticariensis FP35 = DSM 16096]|uniref:Type III secretion protein n=1 Tax=Litchfieldella anticariensis (strain DSM 16096 / CECT 5854 / CIP 108499 / LMG 22089 / FP35) TaxID=1121939 RepID=S2KK64_LITA3|nr:hypothetical protein [Halomonas anticariensis]EPC00823.1 hypothetical protein L861_13615 [Halomonas anticariensis FP35 = DSM 16096]